MNVKNWRGNLITEKNIVSSWLHFREIFNYVFEQNLRLILFLLLLYLWGWKVFSRNFKSILTQCNRTLSTKHFLHYPSLETCKSIVVQSLEPSRKNQGGCINQTYVALTFFLPICKSLTELNPRPFDREPSSLPLDHSFRLIIVVWFKVPWTKQGSWNQIG